MREVEALSSQEIVDGWALVTTKAKARVPLQQLQPPKGTELS